LTPDFELLDVDYSESQVLVGNYSTCRWSI